MKIKVVEWSPVAVWKWIVPDDSCGICMLAFDAAAPGAKYPGDDSPPVFGSCKHAFHMQCIMKWLMQQEKDGQDQTCPLCRTPWDFAGDEAAEVSLESAFAAAAMGEGVDEDEEAGAASGLGSASSRGSSALWTSAQELDQGGEEAAAGGGAQEQGQSGFSGDSGAFGSDYTEDVGSGMDLSGDGQ